MTDLRIEIFPDDLDAAVAFYRDVLRFELVRDDRPGGDPYVALRRGRVRVGAAERRAGDAAARRPPAGVELVLEVDDVDEEFDHVARSGWPIDEGMTQRPWGLTDFRLLDPSGYYWRITGTGG